MCGPAMKLTRKSAVVIAVLIVVWYLVIPCRDVFSADAYYDITGGWNSQVSTVYCSCPYPLITSNSGQFIQTDDTFQMITSSGVVYSGSVNGTRYSASTTFSNGTVGYIRFTVLSPATGAGTYSQYDFTMNCYNETAFTMNFDSVIIMNTAPDIPVLSSPENGSAGVSLTPDLTTGAFSDPDTGNTHQKTDWQVSTWDDFSGSVLYESSATRLTALTVPASVLEGETAYYWRARFYDNRGTASQWSEAFSFTTGQGPVDVNGNGIPDNRENSTADLNGDGIPDIRQTDEIKTLNTVVGNGQMGLSVKTSAAGTRTVRIDSIDPGDISRYARPHSMPLGMLSFTLEVAEPGGTAAVQVFFSESAPENAGWLFYDSINGWSDYSEFVTFSADRKSAVLLLKDGDYGDADGLENGIIVDPSGFGIGSWLTGKITDDASEEPLSSGTVTVSDIDLTVHTLPDGSFVTLLLPGTYDLSISASGYRTAAVTGLTIDEGSIHNQNVRLEGRCLITGMQVAGPPSTTGKAKFTVNAQSGGDIINYRYSIHDGYGTAAYDGRNWRSMTTTEYITDNSCGYKFDTSGKSIVVAWATSSAVNRVTSTGIPIIGWSVDTSSSGCPVNFTGVTMSGEQKVNEKLTISVSAASGCTSDLFYRFSMHPYYGTSDYDGTHWTGMTATEWISTGTIDYSFTASGKYIVVVWVTDDTSSAFSGGVPIIGWSVDIEP